MSSEAVFLDLLKFWQIWKGAFDKKLHECCFQAQININTALVCIFFSQVPELVKEYQSGTTLLDKYITHRMKFDQINEAFALLHSGEALRAVLTFDWEACSQTFSIHLYIKQLVVYEIPTVSAYPAVTALGSEWV